MDYVDVDNIDTKGVRINAVLLGRLNENMKKLCEKSGGFLITEELYGKKDRFHKY